MIIHNYKQVKTVDAPPGVTMRIVCGVEEKVPNFVMRHFEFEPGAAMPFHKHPWEHEFFVLEGQGVIKTKDGDKPIQKGDAAVVLPNELHSVRNTSQEKLAIICLVPLVDGQMPVAKS